MKAHKIIDSARVLTAAQLESLRLTKGEAFANLDGSFDYALPQGWLDDFAQWCERNPGRARGATYDLILGSTVWKYDDGTSCPVSCCSEVICAYNAFHRFIAEKHFVA